MFLTKSIFLVCTNQRKLLIRSQTKFVKCIQLDPKTAALQFIKLISLKYIERGEIIN